MNSNSFKNNFDEDAEEEPANYDNNIGDYMDDNLAYYHLIGHCPQVNA